MTFFKKTKLIPTSSIIVLSIFLLFNSEKNISYALNTTNNTATNQNSNLYIDLDSLISEINKNKNKSNIEKEDFLKIKDTAYELYNNIDVNKDSITQAKLNYILGVSYFYLFEYEKANNHLIISSQNFSNEIDYTIQIDNYYLLSKINLNNGEKAESMKFFNQAINLGISNSDYILISNLYLLRASDLSRDNNNIDEIKLNINNAIKIAEDNQTLNQAQVYYEAGLLYSNKLDRILLSNELLFKAQSIFKTNENIIGEVNCKIKLANNYLLLNDNDSAINLLSPLLSEDLYVSNISDLAYIIINLYLVDAYTSISDFENANIHLDNLEVSLSEYDSTQKIDALILKHIYKANLLCKQNNNKAFEEINKAFELYNNNLEYISVSNLNIILEGTLGDIYFNFNNIEKALIHHDKALELSKNNIDSINTMKYTKKLASDNESLGNYKKSSLLFKQFNELLQTFISNNSSKLLYNFDYEYNEIDSIYIDLNNNNKEKNKFNLIDITLISLLSMSSVYSLYLTYKLYKLKHNESKQFDKNKLTDIYNMEYLNSYLLDKWNIFAVTKSNISLLSVHIDIKHNLNCNVCIINEIISNLKHNSLRDSDIIVFNDTNSSTKKSNIQSYEFLIPLLNVNKEESINISERITNAISNISFEDIGLSEVKINSYIGIATLIPVATMEYSSLIHRSYASLYHSMINKLPISHIDDVVEML